MPRPRPERPNYKLRRVGRIWRIAWWDADSGRTRTVTTGETDRASAEEALAAYLAELDAPDLGAEPTIADILDAYLKDRDGQVADHARLRDAAKQVIRHIGWMEAGSITPSACRRYVKLRHKDGVKDGTIGKELGTLRAAVNLAEAERWIDRAPTIELPSRPAPRDRWLTHEEARKVRRAASPHVRVFITLALHTAARPKDILSMRWSQVDFDHGLVSLGKSVGNKRRAVVPMNRPLRWMLERAKQVATTAYVIEYGGRHVASVKKAIARAGERAGVDGVTPYVFRHTSATWMAMAGVPMDVIARYLGHTSPSVTARVYAKWHPDYLREASEALTKSHRKRSRIGRVGYP